MLLHFLIVIIRTDVNGDSLWTKRLAGNNCEYSNSIQKTTDGGFIIAGDILYCFSGAFSDAYLVKIGGNGNVIWVKTFGPDNTDGAHYAQETKDGGYFVIARETRTPESTETYLIKTDENGEL